ncbi:MAG: acetyl-CoA carboxylase carboxyl transferase subunit beta, partial [Chlorobiota bacterium]
MAWFKRKKENIAPETSPKGNIPDGLWEKCADCGEI